jgi:8-oxo-dGTP diphosphatase
MKHYYVAGFLFSPDKKRVVLIKKNKPEWQAGKYNAVGGKMELFDYCAQTAMTREFMEEAGVRILEWKEYCKLTGKYFDVYFFRAFGDVNSVHTQEEEEIHIVPVSEIQTLPIISNIPWLIQMDLDVDDIHATVIYND